MNKKISKIHVSKHPKYIELKGFLSFFILHELDKKHLTGEELARFIGSRKNTMLTPGTIYPALKKLRKSKLILYERDGRKKVYSLTTSGRAELKSLYFVLKSLFRGVKR